MSCDKLSGATLNAVVNEHARNAAEQEKHRTRFGYRGTLREGQRAEHQGLPELGGVILGERGVQERVREQVRIVAVYPIRPRNRVSVRDDIECAVAPVVAEKVRASKFAPPAGTG